MIQKIKEWAGVVAALAGIALLAVVLVGGNQSAPGFGGTTNFDALQLDNGGLTIVSGNIAITSGNITATAGSTVLGTTTVETLVTGGFVVASSTTNTAETIAQNLLLGGSLLLTPNTGATTYTLTASTSITNLVPNSGDMQRLYVRNATSTTGASGLICFAGNTGTILEVASTTNSIANNCLGGGKAGFLNFWRSSTTTNVYVDLQPFQ